MYDVQYFVQRPHVSTKISLRKLQDLSWLIIGEAQAEEDGASL